MSQIRFTDIELSEVYASLSQLPDDAVTVESLHRGESGGIIDVRSPGEYAEGHVPNAINVPLFSDDQRAAIGKLYKREGSEQAIALGLKYAESRLPLLASLLQEAFVQLGVVDGGAKPTLHCWRGGMRSRAVKWLCNQLGYNVSVLEGGYKSFRGSGLRKLSENRQLVVLAGPTGCGKTKILKQLAESGEQVLDLEGLAKHRGSVFGAFEGVRQPTVEQFQNEIFTQWDCFDPDRIIWVEGESQKIGRAVIPEPLWRKLVAAPMIFVDCSVNARVDFLLDDYGSRDRQLMIKATERIKKRLGGLMYREALEAVDTADWTRFCTIMLGYYDKYYLKALENRAPMSLRKVELDSPGVLKDQDHLVHLAHDLLFKGDSTDKSWQG